VKQKNYKKESNGFLEFIYTISRNSLVGINKSIIQSNLKLLEENQQLQQKIEMLSKEKDKIYMDSIPKDSPFCNMKLHQQW
jgi:hypothetical protein